MEDLNYLLKREQEECSARIPHIAQLHAALTSGWRTDMQPGSGLINILIGYSGPTVRLSSIPFR